MKSSQKILVKDAFVKWTSQKSFLLVQFCKLCADIYTQYTFIYSIRILASELVLACSQGY